MSDPGIEVARAALAALSRADGDGFAELAAPDVEIHTARGVRTGREEARAWAARRYDHLDRRYEIDELRRVGDRVLARGCVQYAWRETGEIGDESPVAIEIGVADGSLTSFRFVD